MGGRDQYMNFFAMTLTSGASSATLTSSDYNTGAGVATLLAWRVHKVEFFSDGSWSGGADASKLAMAISTRKDLAAYPDLTDKGLIAGMANVLTVYGTPATIWESKWPHVIDFLPPMIIASPNISFYFQCSANFAGQQTKSQKVRMGFTTEKLGESAYREIFETWNYAN